VGGITVLPVARALHRAVAEVTQIWAKLLITL
jgi:hypothetical protein